jgi:hypothetical protein
MVDGVELVVSDAPSIIKKLTKHSETECQSWVKLSCMMLIRAPYEIVKMNLKYLQVKATGSKYKQIFIGR